MDKKAESGNFVITDPHNPDFDHDAFKGVLDKNVRSEKYLP